MNSLPTLENQLIVQGPRALFGWKGSCVSLKIAQSVNSSRRKFIEITQSCSRETTNRNYFGANIVGGCYS